MIMTKVIPDALCEDHMRTVLINVIVEPSRTALRTRRIYVGARYCNTDYLDKVRILVRIHIVGWNL